MSQPTILTKRDIEILLALVHKVRLFSLRQITRHWWNGHIANARRRLNVLAAGDLVCPMTVSVRTLPPLSGPILAWRPGHETPAFGAVSYQLKLRWKMRAVRPIRAFVATPRAARLLGGKACGQLKPATQATHDLGVAAVWLRFHAHHSAWASAWRSEDIMAHTRRGQKLPDAFIVNDRDKPIWAIEFGGAYDPHRVKDFHEDCASRALPYQIW